MKVYTQILLIYILSFSSSLLFGQSDTLILKASSIVGDTIDLREKRLYGLFEDVTNEEFSFGQYISVKGNTQLKITKKDGTISYKPYKIEWVLSDGGKIDSKGPAYAFSSIADKPSNASGKGKKKFLKLFNSDTQQVHYFKEGKRIYYKLKNEKEYSIQNLQWGDHDYKMEGLTDARLEKILDEGIPAIKVIIQDGKNTSFIIPLEDFEVIVESNKERRIIRKSIGVILSLMGGVFIIGGTMDELPPLTIAGVGISTFGLIKVFKPKKYFDLTKNSEIQIVYNK